MGKTPRGHPGPHTPPPSPSSACVILSPQRAAALEFVTNERQLHSFLLSMTFLVMPPPSWACTGSGSEEAGRPQVNTVHAGCVSGLGGGLGVRLSGHWRAFCRKWGGQDLPVGLSVPHPRCTVDNAGAPVRLGKAAVCIEAPVAAAARNPSPRTGPCPPAASLRPGPTPELHRQQRARSELVPRKGGDPGSGHAPGGHMHAPGPSQHLPPSAPAGRAPRRRPRVAGQRHAAWGMMESGCHSLFSFSGGPQATLRDETLLASRRGYSRAPSFLVSGTRF